MKPTVDTSTNINNEYNIHEEIGRGRYSVVHRVTDKQGKEYAAKFTRMNTKNYIYIINEHSCMRTASDRKVEGKIHKHYSGKHGKHFVIVMDLLGQTIRQYVTGLDADYSSTQLIKFAINMTERVEDLHRRGFIHNDIKLDNFMTGRGDQERNTVHLIDFGSSERYRDNDEDDGEVSSEDSDENISLSSTKPGTRKTDLEQLVYCIVDLWTGKFPWSQTPFAEEEHNVAEERKFPKEFRDFCRYIASLGRHDTPDYEHLLWFLGRLLARMPKLVLSQRWVRVYSADDATDELDDETES